MIFLEYLEENVKSHPDRCAVCLNHNEQALTYKSLWENSGKVYAYLKKHNIGREDFVLIKMPRDPRTYVYVIGVMRAGAAFCVVEDTYPAERINFIVNDLKAKLLLDEASYEEAMAGEAASGYENSNPHDAAFAVYTSGTTGTPKGVLHEYGNLDLPAHYFRSLIKDEGERYASILPFNFVALLIEMTSQLIIGSSIYILDYSIARNLEKYCEFIKDEQIQSLHMPPSLLRRMKEIAPSVKRITIGTEPANGLYIDNIEITNLYAQSETYFSIATIILDRSYDKAPVGKNRVGLDIKILDDDGNELPDGSVGEISFKNEYFRGYINSEKQTEYAFRGGIYHTGDLGYKNEDGNLVLSGRKDDMIKINGNRIEPAEIEAAGKRLLGVTQAIAKGFEEENGRSYVALYYVLNEGQEKISRDKESQLIKEFADILPAYMVPAYLVEIDKIPTVTNGKADRKALPKININDYKTSYEAPENETESIICRAIETVLHIKKVGRNDDFYMLGGDSLTSLELVTLIDLPNLVTSDIFKGRCPAKIAELYAQKQSDDEIGNRINEHSSYKLQRELLDKINEQEYDKYLKTGEISSYYSCFFPNDNGRLTDPMLNPGVEYVLKDKVDPDRLLASVEAATKVYPFVTFGIRYANEPPFVRFNKIDKPLIVHKASENVQFGSKENNGLFSLVSYEDCRISFRVCHVLTDGHGMLSFIHKVLDYYFGISKPDEDDITLSKEFLADLMKGELPLSNEEKKLNEALFEAVDAFDIPESSIENPEEFNREMITVKRDSYQKFCDKYGLSAQLGAVLMLAKAIKATHKDCNKTISIRMPVDTRTILGAKKTFQNASVPSVVIRVSPDSLNKENTLLAAEEIQNQFEQQFSYRYLAEFTNRVGNALKAVRLDNFEPIITMGSWYSGLSDIFVSYLGRLDSPKWEDNIDSVVSKAASIFKLMVYVYEYKDKVVFEYIQSVENAEYLNNFKSLLKEFC